MNFVNPNQKKNPDLKGGAYFGNISFTLVLFLRHHEGDSAHFQPHVTHFMHSVSVKVPQGQIYNQGLHFLCGFLSPGQLTSISLCVVFDLSAETTRSLQAAKINPD